MLCCGAEAECLWSRVGKIQQGQLANVTPGTRKGRAVKVKNSDDWCKSASFSGLHMSYFSSVALVREGPCQEDTGYSPAQDKYAHKPAC